MVCENDHGCAPLPIGDDLIHGIQEADPRPRRATAGCGHERDVDAGSLNPVVALRRCADSCAEIRYIDVISLTATRPSPTWPVAAPPTIAPTARLDLVVLDERRRRAACG